ncbi:MAG TPA: translation initiation factor IF-3 [Nocardioidaceae bacterium]|nr:translation initiation factor IF-3 [Nocardioidaceae bacterium]
MAPGWHPRGRCAPRGLDAVPSSLTDRSTRPAARPGRNTGAARLVDQGDLTSGDHVSHPHRPSLHQVVGSGPAGSSRRAARRWRDDGPWVAVRRDWLPLGTWRRPFCCLPRVHNYTPDTHGGTISTELRINDRIRVPEVRLVGPNGETVGIVRIDDALRLAQEADLDLVEVAPTARPPVCKLMDYGKFKYENAQKAREARRNQTNVIIKEMKLRPKIDAHDYETKKGHVVRFLKAGDKVKITIMFRGREQHRPELGFRLLQRLAEDVDDLGFVESSPKQDGRNMIMVLGPHKKKAEAKLEVRAAKAERAAERDAEREAEHAERTATAPTAPQDKKPRRRSENIDLDM